MRAAQHQTHVQEAVVGAGGQSAHVLLLLEPGEHVNDRAGRVAVPDVDGRGAGPALQVVERQRDVLRDGLVEDPDLAGVRGPRHAVPVEVKQNPFVLGIPPEVQAQLLHRLDGRVNGSLVPAT